MVKSTTNFVKNYRPNIDFGLSDAQVKERTEDGFINKDKTNSVKSTKQIIKDNLFNLFNFVNLVLAIAILCVGSYRNLMFMGVVICNAFIGIWQEIKAKHTIEKLNLISTSEVVVIRSGKKQSINIENIVLDDIIIFESGNQIPADCVILRGECNVNESLLTGEPDSIAKKKGDKLLSGSYIISGNCTAQATAVGANSFSSSILKSTKLIKKTKSEIMSSLEKIIKIISIAIIPMGAVLFYRQLTSSGNNYISAIEGTAAALTGMIPEGLVLLTSSVLAVGVVRLSRKKVLVQDIYSLETLARVDTLCLDKTGTITEGTFELQEIIPKNNFTQENVSKALKFLSSNLEDNNETFKVICQNFLPDKNYKFADKIFPFSSDKKWSGVHIPQNGSYILGAAKFIFGDKQLGCSTEIEEYSKDYRVLILAHSSFDFENDEIPPAVQPMALILIKDKIRYNAEKTLNFFKNQGVDIKVISGDDPITVSQIAKRVDLKNAENYVDATHFKSFEEIKSAVSKYTIFGRVTPSQKQDIIKALKSDGHTVAMVGDGVNDVLAMKEADCGVAMANGSEIARNVAHLVLLNSDFASMPRAVAEGRKAINNLQRSSSLFLSKTIYSFLLAFLFFIIPAPYPFIPIQMTLISALTIGIPSFILGLEPNKEKIHGNLFQNILSKSLPAALSIVTVLLACVGIYSWCGISMERYSFLTVILTGILGTILLYNISKPLNNIRKTLLCSVIIAFFIAITKFYGFFEIERLKLVNILILIPMVVFAVITYLYLSQVDWKKLFNMAFKKSKA
ncbi:MAG: HAD-IC family P-type ATPase [Clostridia bacterium]|nr:HAD-IC family P-type ATPase [Clostridia bacterium]